MWSKTLSNSLKIKITVFKKLMLMKIIMNIKFHLINGILNPLLKSPFLNFKVFKTLQDNLMKETLKNSKGFTFKQKDLKVNPNRFKKYWINSISYKVQVNYKEKVKLSWINKKVLYRFWSNSDKEKGRHLFKRKTNTWWFKILLQKRK